MSEHDDASHVVGVIAEALYQLGNNTTDPARPFTGQPHTDQGVRGTTMVEGLRFRDVADCMVLGFLYACGRGGLAESGTATYNDVYEAIARDPGFDPVAVIQNALCEMEKRMGIYPNVPPLHPAPTDPPSDTGGHLSGGTAEPQDQGGEHG